MHSKYWSQRFDQIEQSANNQSTKYIRSLEKKYTTAASEIDKSINAWYRRIAKNNSISVKEAKKLLAGSELNEFKWTVEEYIKFGQQNAIDQSWMKELENASAKFHISRLEAMKLEARQQVERLFAGGQETMYDVMGSVYKDSFYHSCFEIQKGVGVGFDVSRLDDKQVRTLLQRPWSVDGTNFSEKLWGNKRKLINTLDQELSRMVLTGESPDKAIKNIKHAMGTSLSSARRLVLTEQAYFTSIAQKDAYAELDVEEFEFVGTLDGKTCGDCGELDGQHFPMKDMMPGVNAAPMHPFCRCTTAPYFDDEFTIGKRIAKDKDGEYYEVPEKMTFDEWKETFVDGGSKDDLTVVTEGDTVKSKRDYDSDLAQNFGKDHYDGMHDLIDSCVNDDLRDVWDGYEGDVLVGDAAYSGHEHYKPSTGKIYLNGPRDAKGSTWQAPYQVTFHESGHSIDYLANARAGGSKYQTFSYTYENNKFGDTIKSEIDDIVNKYDKELKVSFKEHADDIEWLHDNDFISDWNYNFYKDYGSWISGKPKYSKSYAYKALEKEIRLLDSMSRSDLSDIVEGATKGKIKCGFGHGNSYWKDESNLPTEAFAEMLDSEMTNPQSLETIKKYLPKSYEVFCELLKVMKGL